MPETEDGCVELPWPTAGRVDRSLPSDGLALASALLLDALFPDGASLEIRLLQPVSAAMLDALRGPDAWPRIAWFASESAPCHASSLEALVKHGRSRALAEALGLLLPPVRLALFGTSRLHRSFARREPDGSVRLQRTPTRQPLFARLGYFHGAREIAQTVSLLTGRFRGDPRLLPFAFRVENVSTTPCNEFDATTLASLRGGQGFVAPPDGMLDQANAVAIEISSLRVNLHRPSGMVLHSNPNLLHDVSYRALYPQGYYEKFLPWLGVESLHDDEDGVVKTLSLLQEALAGKAILVIGHLASARSGHGERRQMNALIERACAAVGLHYVDTANLLDRYGFAQVDGMKDPHHLAPEGEDELGRLLFERAAEALRDAFGLSVRSPLSPVTISDCSVRAA